MLGIVSGIRRLGRQRMCWLDMIKGDTKMKVQLLKEAVLDRVAWRVLASKVAKSGTQLNG